MGKKRESGYTLVELMIGIVLLGLLAISMLTLFSTLIRSTVIIKREAVAADLAITQMEYLKSLPYNSLAVSGGPIIAPSYIPALSTTVLNGVTYTTKTDIDYIDDAFDGCAAYPDVTTELTECRNFVVHNGPPTSDGSPKDYKIAHVKVTDQNSLILAEVDSEISARVAETASTTGALFVKVLDSSGTPVAGATIQVTNNKLAPVISQSDTTDASGIAIFYDLPPDTSGYNYSINASLANYSSLTTIVPAGSLVPTYTNQKIITQASSFVTLTLKPLGTNSLVVETTDTSGAPISGMKVYVKGGYKKYTALADTSYYYDNQFQNNINYGTPTVFDNRPTTDIGGLTALTNLVPGNYIFCAETADTKCSVGNTTYYVAAVLPYSGNNPFNPLTVPTYTASNPPSTTFTYNSSQYLQKVRLMMTTTIGFPRVYTLLPNSVLLSSSNLSAFAFTITGANLPCSSNAASCGTTITFTQGGTTYTASCTGTTGTIINCTSNLTGIAVGSAQLKVKVGANTLTIPAGAFLGGFSVSP
jgi:type II secretory pathway pseudopilin PulG